ncbi:nucleoside recognition domain-containing protein [Desulfoscipio sp. XC116]|uniref:nucleoside recognition domain-containing protein n=1 Tax=Desulfoscipio sp. XC116 TaxID=3144975 RepID=UPI00325AC3F3
MVTLATWKRGLYKGFSTIWDLVRVIVPVYVVVTFLKYTPIMDWIAGLFAPVMHFFGLPGEASLVLVLGKLINIYAAIGAISSLELTGREVTIIAAILLLSHNLPVESAVSHKTGISGLLMTALRLIMGILAGLTINMFW